MPDINLIVSTRIMFISAKLAQLNNKSLLSMLKAVIEVAVINGEVVLEYSNLKIGGGMTNNTDPAVYQIGKPLNNGYIALQSGGQEIDFRNITIVDLSK